MLVSNRVVSDYHASFYFSPTVRFTVAFQLEYAKGKTKLANQNLKESDCTVFS